MSITRASKQKKISSQPSESDHAKIIVCYKDGDSAAKIARAIKSTEWHVLNVLKLHGIARRPARQGPAKRSEK
jgi:hypothetical protein